MQILSKLMTADLAWVNGFLTTGVILILVGIKNVTVKDLKEYKQTHNNTRRLDELVAWGVFYIVFGVLITAGAAVSIYPYLK